MIEILTKLINKQWWKISCSMKVTHSVSDNLKKLLPKMTFLKCQWDLPNLKPAEWVICLDTTIKVICLIETLGEEETAMVLWESFLNQELIRGKHQKQIYYILMTLDLFQKEEIQIRRKIVQTELQCKEIRNMINMLLYLILNQTIQLNMIFKIFRKTFSNNLMMMMFASLLRLNVI